MGRNYKQFSLEERGEIARLRADGQSLRQIATNLGRTASSVLRELKRNSGASVGYKPVYADDLAWGRRWRGSTGAPASSLPTRDEQAWGACPGVGRGDGYLRPSAKYKNP